MTDPAPARTPGRSRAMLPRAHQPGARRWSSAAAPGPARMFHTTLPGYRPTPLVGLPGLAAELGVAQVWMKDEADRFGLPAFKTLGASWAVNRAMSTRAGHPEPAGSLDELRRRAAGSAVTLVTATDGNHGRALARIARLLEMRSRIYVADGPSSGAVDAIAGEGAEVVRTSLVYDDVVRLASRSVQGRPDDVLVQDTSWPGYTEIPRWIVEGYSTLFSELDDQLGGPVDLVAVPTGVGSLLQAARSICRSDRRQDRPAVLAVEPAGAACHRVARRRTPDHRRHLLPHGDGRPELRHRLRHRLAGDLRRPGRRRRGARGPGAIRAERPAHRRPAGRTLRGRGPRRSPGGGRRPRAVRSPRPRRPLDRGAHQHQKPSPPTHSPNGAGASSQAPSPGGLPAQVDAQGRTARATAPPVVM